MESETKYCSKCKCTQEIKEFIKINKTCNHCNDKEKEKRKNKSMNKDLKKKTNKIKSDDINYIIIEKEKLEKIVSNDIYIEILKNKV